jgi:divalent metal cation (Fe/Co/Zn/Cd) transporter
MTSGTGFELPMATAPLPARATRVRDADWHRAARLAVLLSWASLFYMAVEGSVGVWQGVTAGSIALVGWGLASFIEGIASAIIVWRFTGDRRLSDTAESRAQKLVAIQFFILAPYVLVESAKTLIEGGHPDVTVIGMVLTGTSVVLMPLLGNAKHRLAERLGSTATAGEGTQNVLCGVQAAAVLVGLAANAAVGAWWLDPLIGLFIAFVAVREGLDAWRGETCADCSSSLALVVDDEAGAGCCADGSCSDADREALSLVSDQEEWSPAGRSGERQSQ